MADDAREFTCWQIAKLLYPEEAKGADKSKRRKLVIRVKRRLRRLGIARQDVSGTRVFTTERDLRSRLPHVWVEATEQ